MFSITSTSLISRSKIIWPPTWYLFLELIICFVKFRWHSDKENLIRHLSNHTCILTASAGGGFFKTNPFTLPRTACFPWQLSHCVYVCVCCLLFLWSSYHTVFPLWRFSCCLGIPLHRKTSWSYVFLWENAHFTLMLHFEDGHNIRGVPPNRNVSQAWEDISLRSWGICADDISLGICPLQRCPHSTALFCSLRCHHIFHLKIQAEEYVYNSSIRNSLRKSSVGGIQK